jgi:peptide subunit release factor 1 (eRF1)
LQRWRVQRDQLAGQGAPEPCLDAIEELVGPAHLVGESLAVIADAGGVIVVRHLQQARDDDRASWALLPDLVPLLRWHQDQIPYVLVLADHGGADIIAEHPGHRTLHAEAGDGDPERKSAPGGWSQKRYQQRAEEDWAATARDVAAEVATAAGRVGAEIVILGGDVRSTHLIHEQLPSDLAARVRFIDHGRALDGSEDEREREVHRLVATAVAESSVALLESFKEERGQHDRAADGLAATVEALNRAAVEVLLIGDVEGPTAWVTVDSPVPVGIDAATAATGTETTPVEVPARDALIRAAFGTGAAVRIIPTAGPAAEGIGALLRWSNQEAQTEGR